MDIQTKNLIEKQNKAFHRFKVANDERLDQLDAKGNTDPLLEEKVDKANAEIARLGKHLEEVYKKLNRPGGTGDDFSAPSKGFDRYLRTGDTSELGRKSFSVGTDADGGYAVPEQLDANLRNFMFDANVMRQICTVIQAESSNYKVAVNTGGLTAGWVGEKTARPETDTPTIAEVTPPTGELYANPAATKWMIEDAGFNLESWLMTEVQNKFASMEGDAFINGDGTNQPKGVLDYPSAATDDDVRAFGTLKHTVTAGATAITLDEIIDFTYDLRGVYRAQAVFLMNSATAGYLRKLKDSNGLYLWQPSLTAGQPPMLAGFPVKIDENVQAIATGSVSVLFGNFSQGYSIVDRSPLQVLRDPFTNKPFTHFYSTKRVSGMLVDSNAIRLLQQA